MSSPGSASGPSAGAADRDHGFGPADDDGRTSQNRRRSGGRTPGAHRASKSEGLLPGFGRGKAKPDRGARPDGAGPPASSEPDTAPRRGLSGPPASGRWPDPRPEPASGPLPDPRRRPATGPRPEGRAWPGPPGPGPDRGAWRGPDTPPVPRPEAGYGPRGQNARRQPGAGPPGPNARPEDETRPGRNLRAQSGNRGQGDPQLRPDWRGQ